MYIWESISTNNYLVSGATPKFSSIKEIEIQRS